jgi:hypothetical protein
MQAAKVGPIEMMPGRIPAAVAEIFQGYDTFTGQARARAVQGSTRTSDTKVEVTCKVYKGVESLSRALDIAASAQAGFEFGAVGMKAEFVKDLDLTTTSVTILVHASVNYREVMTSVAPADGVDTSDLGAFFRAYGDSYVDSLTRGAEYIAVYCFYSQTLAEQERLAADITATISTAAVDGELKSKIGRVWESTQVRKYRHHTIVGAPGVASPSEDDAVKFALDFSQKVGKTADSVIAYRTAGYDHVAGMPDFSKISANRALIQQDDGRPGDVPLKLTTLRGVANQIAWLTDSASGFYQTYRYTGDTLLRQRARQIRADIDSLERFVYALAADPTQRSTPPAAPSLAFGAPRLGFEVSFGKQLGIVKGATFEDADYGKMLQQVKLSSLQFITDYGVVALLSKYEGPDGATHTTTHGGTEGTKGDTLKLQPGEFIGRISVVTSGNSIRKLKFVTNQGRELCYPPEFKSTDDGAETWTARPGQVLIGIKGRSSDVLNSVQAIVINLKPAVWEDLPANPLQ